MRMSDGTIPEGASLSNSGDGRITRLNLQNRNGAETSDYFYGSPVQINFDFDSEIELEKCLIGIQVKNSLNESIQDFVNIYDKKDLQIQKGLNHFSVQLQNQFHPGKYYINLTIARFNGVPLDTLESIAEMNVLAMGETADSGYPFGWTNGYLKGTANWEKK